VGLVPNIWTVPTAGAPALGPGFLPARTPLGRLRDFALRQMVGRILDRAVPALNETRRGLGLDPIKSFFDPLRRADAILVLSSAAFDFSSPFVPGNVRYTGPILDDPMWAGSWTAPWPRENRDPLVLVGFSSTFQDQGPVLRNVVQALSGMPVRALVTLGEMLPDGEVQGSRSVVVVRSAPHSPVLAQAAAVISHCGHGTTLKALAAGVPLLCMPIGRDQNDTAARVVHAGAGVRIKPASTPAQIGRALRQVLEDGHVRANAERMRDTLAREMRSQDVVAEMERVAGLPAGILRMQADARASAPLVDHGGMPV
jgi:MGT family glycosyltransferase